MVEISVVFPLPEKPTMAMNSPSFIRRLMLFKTEVLLFPQRVLYQLVSSAHGKLFKVAPGERNNARRLVESWWFNRVNG
jgi:hypothetical protein